MRIGTELAAIAAPFLLMQDYAGLQPGKLAAPVKVGALFVTLQPLLPPLFNQLYGVVRGASGSQGL
jgi:hypothetical protein